MKLLRHQSNQRARRGFSLAELMVVIVILGLLMTIVVPNVMKRLKTAQAQTAKSDMVGIMSALDDYAINNGGSYPDSMEELIMEDENGESYLGHSELPQDPWGHEYQYEPEPGNRKYRLYTLGADGAQGGEGENADIDNEDVKKRGR